jgi:tetratricopeptide (TPR) repeat protein
MDVRTLMDRARILSARGHLVDALRLADSILVELPDQVDALLLKGGLLLEGHEGELALSLYERAVKAAPNSVEALNGLARCLHALSRDTEALETAERARGLLGEGDNFRQTAPVYLTLVWCLREKRQLKEALDVAEEGLRKAPDAVLAQWASLVEEELAEAEKTEC